jgi:hypothetical protein
VSANHFSMPANLVIGTDCTSQKLRIYRYIDGEEVLKDHFCPRAPGGHAFSSRAADLGTTGCSVP